MSSLVDYFQSLNIRDLYRRIAKHDQRITHMEVNMSQLDDVIAEMNTETNDIGTRIDNLAAQIIAGDTSAASKLAPLSARLKALASDPTNVVPPAPADSATSTDSAAPADSATDSGAAAGDTSPATPVAPTS